MTTSNFLNVPQSGTKEKTIPVPQSGINPVRIGVILKQSGKTIRYVKVQKLILLPVAEYLLRESKSFNSS